MKRALRTVVTIVGLLVLGCGGDDDPAGSGTEGSNSFTATIDGASWKSDAALIQVSGPASPTRQGTLVISGFESSSGRGVQLILSFVVGPAPQYPIGVNIGTTPGGTGSVLVGGNTWVTRLSGSSGSVNITVRTETRIAGTFGFAAEAAVPGTLPLARAVSNGSFDITIDEGLPPLPTDVGSTSFAEIGGVGWRAGTTLGSKPSGDTFAITAYNDRYRLVITPRSPMAIGSYVVGSQVDVQVIEVGTSNSWAVLDDNDVGTFNITTFDSNRLIATFQAALPMLGGGTGLIIADGTINAYLEN